MHRPQKSNRQQRLSFLSGVITLAGWRWRQQWLLLLLTWLGVTLAIVLVCSLPLFYNVMTTAGIRSILRSSPYSNQLVATADVEGLSSQEALTVPLAVRQQMQSQLGNYLDRSTSAEIINTGPLNFLNALPAVTNMKLYSADLAQGQAHLQIIQGRFPRATSNDLEVMLTTTTATDMEVKVGSLLQLSGQFATGPLPVENTLNGTTSNDPHQAYPTIYTQAFSARVVGIFRTIDTDSYWNGVNFDAPAINATTQAPGPPPVFAALTSNAFLLRLADQIAQQHHTSMLFATDPTHTDQIALPYALPTGSITNTGLDDVISRLNTLQQSLLQTFHGTDATISINSPYILDINLFGQMLHFGGNTGSLEQFRNEMELARTPILILTLEIASLILFFISIMTGALIEQQQSTLAVLRSRGASRRQLFGSLCTQCLALCLTACLVGPFLAILLVSLLAPHLLPGNLQDAVNSLTSQLNVALSSTISYALLALAISLATMNVTIFFALRATIITLRREETRSTRRPLWQRLHLDLFLALVALASYAFTIYFQSTQQFINLQSQSLLAPLLQLLAPLLLLLAAILCFLRLYPLLLRTLTHLAQHRRGLSAMLALTQMERAPQRPMRMALLLGLATAFALFTLIFTATQAQYIQNLAGYQSGADFSGALSQNMQSDSLAQDTAAYRTIPGVLSVSLSAFSTVFLPTEDAQGEQYDRTTILNAVDANTFAQTAIWSTQDSSQPLSFLMEQLVAQRAQAIKQNIVPAIVDASTWQLLNLHPGATFQLTDNLGNPLPITYKAIAEVQHIPPVDNSSQSALITDYQTLNNAFSLLGNPFNLNYAWLRTSDSPADLTHIRQVLNNSDIALGSLVDRRELAAVSASDPLLINLLSALGLGVASTLLLAFLANILLPTLSLRSRLTQFAVLRALGTSPALVTRILVWEQTFVLTTALLLGLIFGALLSLATIPPLIFSGVLPIDLVNAPTLSLYTTQHAIPGQIILPPSLGLALALLLLLCLLALGLMTRLAQRPLLGQILRLDED
jgi:ABC-type antimicrobial peptide transport system permease subunit